MPNKKNMKKSSGEKKSAKQKPVKKTKSEKIEPKTKKVSETRANKLIKTPTLLRGFKDIMPKDQDYWKQSYHTAEGICEAYGYNWMETPILEEASLFVRSVGKGTDIVDKEMYIFEDRDGSKVALRPEATASVVRAYIGHGLHTTTQPVKVWYWGPMFRHDRPQAGRFRELHQFGCENIGVHEPVIDAELISVAYNFLNDLGVACTVHINSIGTAEDRERYVIELVGYLRSKRSYLCEDCRRRINKNPMRCLDCKQESCQPVIEEAPQIIDWLSDASKTFFMTVLEYLDEINIPYVLDSTLVRGLDYYTDTVFEIYEEQKGEEKSQNALCGGGRYNGLVEQLGGPPTPGCGFAVGLERVVSVLRRQTEKDVEGEEKILSGPKIFFAHLGDQARRQSLRIIEDLRRSGYVVRHNLGKSSLKSQMEIANKYGVTHTLILGQKEVQDGTIIIRDMESGIQEIVDQKKISHEVKKIVEKGR
ncbi:histidine--tRNA ligase [Patescibacteria group bacterium]|nr:histidine--tRNA ligase [Patescibacteria group bacterium]